ncbi:DUF2505 domain-containing protein [Arcanobacterium canis]
MEFSAQVRYNAAPDVVARVLLSRELADARASKAGVELDDYSFDGTVASVRARVSADVLPEAVKRFASRGFSAEVHARAEANVVAHIVKISGLPVTANFRVALSPDDAGSIAEIRGEVHVSVPFVGKKIEQKAVAQAARALEEDALIVNSVVDTLKL